MHNETEQKYVLVAHNDFGGHEFLSEYDENCGPSLQKG